MLYQLLYICVHHSFDTRITCLRDPRSPEIEWHIRQAWHSFLSVDEYDLEILSVNNFLARDSLLFDMYDTSWKNVLTINLTFFCIFDFLTLVEI